MPIKFDLTKFPNKYFIETGTYLGEGIEKAIIANCFKEIYSIEIDTLRHISVKEQYTYYENISIIRGDSSKVLPALLKQINEPCTFWLDAHYMGDDAEYGKKWCPLLEELMAIKNHHIKTHTILIDDYRCMDNMHFDKERNIPVGFPGKKRLMQILYSINPQYNIRFLDGSVENDVVLARIETIEICQGIVYNLINKVMEDYPLDKFIDKIISESLYEVTQEIEDENKLTEIEERELELLDKETDFDIRNEELELKEARFAERDQELNQREKNVVSKEEYVRLMEAKVNRIDERETRLKEQQEELLTKEENLIKLEQKFKNFDNNKNNKFGDLNRKEKRLIKMEAKAKVRASTLDELENELNQREQELFMREENVVEKERRMREWEETLTKKEEVINQTPIPVAPRAEDNKRSMKQRMTRREDRIVQMEKKLEQRERELFEKQKRFDHEKIIFDEHLDTYKNSHNMMMLTNQLHELDENITKREKLLIEKEQGIINREEILRIKEETIKDIILDMALGNELNHVEEVERGVRLTEKKQKNNRSRKTIRGPRTRYH